MKLGSKKVAPGRMRQAGLRVRQRNKAAKALARTIEVPRVADLKSEESKASRARSSKNISEQPIDRYRAEVKALCGAPLLGTIGDMKCLQGQAPELKYAERIATLVERAETRGTESEEL